MIYKTASPRHSRVRVTFELPASLWADRIYVVGDFNDWNATATPLRQERDGVWRAVVDLPVGPHYEFRYLIDGRWSTDLHADGCVPNAHGSSNSVVETVPPCCRPDRGMGAGMVHAEPRPTLAETLTVSRSPTLWLDRPEPVTRSRQCLRTPNPCDLSPARCAR
jgi:hypothetical protein